MADITELQQSKEAAINWHTTAELIDGVVVTDALPNAHRFLFTF